MVVVEVEVGGEQYVWFGVDRSLLGFLGGSHPINYLFFSVLLAVFAG